jgi:SP family general alpha glucoside:H+ symporter-like MFS transporter
MCWGAGILLSSGVVRAVVSVHGGAYIAPESPWNAVRRDKIDQARNSLMRLRQDTPDKVREVEATLAYIRHTTAIEKAETAGASFWECFRGTNLRRTEIVSILLQITDVNIELTSLFILELRCLGCTNPLR